MGRMLVLVLALSPALAAADDGLAQWPAVPDDHALSMEDQITDRLTDIGNEIGGRMNKLSHRMLDIHVDGRANRAQLRVGGGNPHYLTFRIDSDWLFADGKARVHATLDLGLAGRELELKLPTMDLSSDSYHGTQLVQLNVPLLERRF